MRDLKDIEIARLRAALFKATSILRMISATIKTGRVREPTPTILQAWAKAMDESSDPLEVSLDGEVPWPVGFKEAVWHFYQVAHGQEQCSGYEKCQHGETLRHYGLL